MSITRVPATHRSQPRDRAPRSFLRRLLALAAAVTIAVGLLVGAPVAGVPADTASAAGLTSGFVDETLVDGLLSPTAIVFAPGGRVFVAEKRGVVKTWASFASLERNDPPTQTIDIRTDVMNFWDRGLLGLAVDPGYPTKPDLYLLYTYNAGPGGTAPTWPTLADGNSDSCPNPPGATTDGCVVTTRLERISVNDTTGASTGRTLLLSGWCQQFPSHSAGSVLFGPDGKLYVSGGEGANFNGGTQDYGQYGGTKPDTTSPVTPKNPCGDPPAGVGGVMTAPTAEGGALRSQSFRRPASETAVLNGAVLRLEPTTGDAAAGNPAIGDPDPIRQRIVAYGLRNPFRMAFRPGTSDLYVGDVGSYSWEEVNRIPSPTSNVPNFGWPCHEGPLTNTYYTSVTPNLCASLTEGNAVRPLFDYPQTGHMADNDGCPPVSPATSAGASISGLAFYAGTAYPSQFRGALFVADYSRDCIVALPPGAGSVPSSSAVPFSSTAKGPVMLTTDPDGDLVYVAIGKNGLPGEIHRFRYQPPVASFSAAPLTGAAALVVSFDGSASSAPAGVASYDWDFGDGTAHGSGTTTQHTYGAGTWDARLTITDTNGVTATMTRTISASNDAPVVTLDPPTCPSPGCWKVGDVIQLNASATDTEDGTLPSSAFAWHVSLFHCHSPNDCHEHELTTVTGVKSTSIVAPDHDAGSFLQITVTVTDSGGRSGTTSRDVAPRQSTLKVVSSPAGLPVSLDGQTGNGSVGPVDVIVGHVATISAASSVSSGEDRWTFSSWSDGGAISHAVTAPASAQTLTATYTHATVDASNTCAGAPIVSAANVWTKSRFGTATDVDWVRFKVTTSGRYRAVLGDLPVDGRLDLYAGCTTLLASSDHAGLRWEEIIATLGPGTYAIKMTNRAGVAGSTDQQWLLQPLAANATLLSAQAAPTTATTLRLVGEVMNTGSTTRAVTVTARLYSATGRLLQTISRPALITNLPRSGRSPFLIVTNRPAGFAFLRYSVTSVSTRAATRILTVTGLTASAPTPDRWTVRGTITNRTATTASSVRAVVAIFDRSGRVQNTTGGVPSPSTLAPAQSTTFAVTFGGLAGPPMATSVRARAS